MGSGGFIGRNLVETLLCDPDVTVTGFGRTARNTNKNVQFIEGNIEDSTILARALRNQDIIYHLISQTIPSSSWDNPLLEIDNNLQPSIKLIELAAAAGVQKICFASSGGTVYGLNDSVLNEDSPTDPFSPYGIIKRTIESFLEYARHRYGVNYDIYRISNAYGEGQDVSKGLGFINTILENIVNGRPVVVYGNGENVRDFIHVVDVGKLLARSVSLNLGASNIFNISSNNPISLNDLLALMKQVTSVDFEIQYRANRLNDNKKVILDNSKIMKLNGGVSLISLKDGVEKTYNYLQKRATYVEKSI